MFRALRRIYHALVPLGLRRVLSLARFTRMRRARLTLWQQTSGRVAAGPFSGLRLDPEHPGECEAPVLLGSYEAETHEWLEREIARGWIAAVNVGSNLGYYSSGLAMRIPGVTVYAFEAEPALRDATRRSAERNGVALRVRALGKADPATLAALNLDRALVVCDCEGYERELLDPAQVPWLARSALCVELHDFAVPGTTDTLRARFAETHECEVVGQGPRDAARWAERAGITPAEAALLATEAREWNDQILPGRWMLLTPRPG